MGVVLLPRLVPINDRSSDCGRRFKGLLLAHRPEIGAHLVRLEDLEMIKLGRVYDKRNSNDGKHYLVERLWPRGVKKTSLQPGWLVQRCCAEHQTGKVVQSLPQKVGGVPAPVFR